jgi:hypothetical protein
MRRAIPAAVLVLLLASCRGDERAEAPSTPAPAVPTASAAPASPPSQFSVAEQNGTVTITFTENGAQRRLIGETRDSGKRKYAIEGGPVVYEVKPGDDESFKLRTPDGKLRWKVKVTPEKIKISDNEENEHPFELKVKDANRVKVVAPEDRELGNVRYENGQINVETAGGRSIFKLTAPKFSGAYGVLLLDTIPEQERHILVAELLSRNR